MITLTFRLKFSSDWHINAGFGQGSTDAVLERDSQGQPIINGSTLRGIFRDALYDLQNLPYINEKNLSEKLLGSGQEQSRWRFSRARLIDPTQNRSHIAAGVRVHPRTRRAEEGKFYQREMGTGDMEFAFTIESRTDAHQEEVEWLVVAACYIRRLGGRRRRGAGECKIVLELPALQDELLTAFENRHFDKKSPADVMGQLTKSPSRSPDTSVREQRFRIFLRTDEPVLIAKRAESGNNFEGLNYIPGRNLRGAIGALAESYTSDAFLSLFMRGGMHFEDLLPLEDGSVLDQAPLGIKTDQGNVFSVFQEEAANAKNYKGYMTLRDGVPLLDAPERPMRIHPKIHPQLKRASAGDLYSYQPIPEGRYFVGEMRLQSNLSWQEFSALTGIRVRQVQDLAIGKAINRSYGACKIWIDAVEDEHDSVPTRIQMPLSLRLEQGLTDFLVMTLASDTILLDDLGRAIRDFHRDWLANLIGVGLDNISIHHQSQSRTRLVDNFDLRSGLPYWRDLAMVRASSVGINLHDMTVDDLADQVERLEKTGIGLRRAEGFGRVIFNHPAHIHLAKGFQEPLTIPPALQISSDHTFTLKSLRQWWSAHLESKLSYDLFQNQKYRTLPRMLVEAELQSAPDVEAFFRDLLESWSDRGKPARFEEHVLNHLRELLLDLDAKLKENDAVFWREGLVMLAERIADLAKSAKDKLAEEN